MADDRVFTIPLLDWANVSPIPNSASAIAHTLCDEDRARIDALTAATNRLAQAIERLTPPDSPSSPGRST